MAKELSTCKVYLLMLVMLITGSINTIANKLQQTTVTFGIEYSRHQKFITTCMFTGEVLCLLFYYIIECRKKNQKRSISEGPLIGEDEGKSIRMTRDSKMKETLSFDSNMEIKEEPEEQEKKQPKFWFFAFPALCDLFASSMSTIGLTFVCSSIYQMFRGAVIIFTCIFSTIFIKKKYYRHHFLGIAIVIVGLIVVGINAIFIQKVNMGEKPVVGMFLVLGSQIFSATLFVIEEKLLAVYNTPALKQVGTEGLWGLMMYIVLNIIFYFIRCESWSKTLKESICIQDDKGTWRFENAIFAFKQIGHNGKLAICLALYIISIAFFNFAGISITKYVSSVARTIIDTVRTIIVWVFFIVMPEVIVPAKAKEKFSVLQLIGFLILIFGSIIYNEIIVLPCCGFNQYTKAKIKQREDEEKAKQNLEKIIEEEYYGDKNSSKEQ